MMVRPAVRADVTVMCAILNEIIEIGGTTAYEQPLSDETFRAHFLEGVDCVSCIVAENEGQVLGFQSLEGGAPLPSGVVAIASFAKAGSGVKGVGRSMFARTKQIAKDAGFHAIDAKIRADNDVGLGFYDTMGFVKSEVVRAVPLSDGRLVDRVIKRYVLRPPR